MSPRAAFTESADKLSALLTNMLAVFRSSTSLEIIRGPLREAAAARPAVALTAARFTLAKRRWRGTAADGREFGFDLERPLRHGDIFFQTESQSYVIAQSAEPVLRIELRSPAEAAATAWQIGNMHFPVEVRDDALLIEDDPVLRQMLERGGIAFTTAQAVFQPLGGGHRH